MRPPLSRAPRTLGLAFALMLGAAPAVADQLVDLELVLAGDASGSIDNTEMQMQRQGYAAALTDPQVLDAITLGQVGAIAVAYIEWAGSFSVDTVVNWTIIRDRASAQAFAEQLLAAPRRAEGYNSIGAAIRYARNLIDNNRFEGLRRVIDIAADGPDIGAPKAAVARDEAVAEDITINGLVIESAFYTDFMSPIPLPQHFAEQVIGGPGAFVTVAHTMADFRDVLLDKLVREISARDQPRPQLAEHRP
jgi:Protein of unknown function (DUF1194)